MMGSLDKGSSSRMFFASSAHLMRGSLWVLVLVWGFFQYYKKHKHFRNAKAVQQFEIPLHFMNKVFVSAKNNHEFLVCLEAAFFSEKITSFPL